MRAFEIPEISFPGCCLGRRLCGDPQPQTAPAWLPWRCTAGFSPDPSRRLGCPSPRAPVKSEYIIIVIIIKININILSTNLLRFIKNMICKFIYDV